MVRWNSIETNCVEYAIRLAKSMLEYRLVGACLRQNLIKSNLDRIDDYDSKKSKKNIFFRIFSGTTKIRFFIWISWHFLLRFLFLQSKPKSASAFSVDTRQRKNRMSKQKFWSPTKSKLQETFFFYIVICLSDMLPLLLSRFYIKFS